ncbi:MAG TPA: phosphatase PAP2 family protein [Thermoanaerobaculia bacterium]|nr:phosphatase PAP2 family protein [Thermoanaerobaculia bacterium]HUM31202.1 phosphatase PAP2 family protein [Thermoanaerobaculia bacterium]HXK69562.1 phosphatase PAP2 family protein [Thermoanaerobaculia bacterium]
MRNDTSGSSADSIPISRISLRLLLTQPYPLTAAIVLPLLILVSCAFFYIFIGDVMMPGRFLHVPEIGLDALFPLRPSWVLVYATLYLYLIVLPILTVRQEKHVVRTILAYLTVWIVAFICFLIYPTAAPRPEQVAGSGFIPWALRLLYSMDPPYNCFPSIHVAHSFVSVFTCYRIHRGVGLSGAVVGLLIGVSTLYTKQHYAVDVLAGILLAYLAHLIFLRPYPREKIPELDRHLAPAYALLTAGFVTTVLLVFWFVYLVNGESGILTP